MSANSSRVKQYLAVAGASVDAMEIVQQVAQGLMSKGTAATVTEIMQVLAGIAGVAKSISDGLDGTATQDDLNAALRELKDSIASNNAVIDAGIDAKFPAGG